MPHPAGRKREVLGRLARRMAAEAREALYDVGRIADLAHLAVADDRDPGLDLPLHRLVDSLLHHAVELGLVICLALVAGEQQRNEFGAARQAADMRGLDHGKALSCGARSFRYAKWTQV